MRSISAFIRNRVNPEDVRPAIGFLDGLTHIEAEGSAFVRGIDKVRRWNAVGITAEVHTIGGAGGNDRRIQVEGVRDPLYTNSGLPGAQFIGIGARDDDIASKRIYLFIYLNDRVADRVVADLSKRWRNCIRVAAQQDIRRTDLRAFVAQDNSLGTTGRITAGIRYGDHPKEFLATWHLECGIVTEGDLKTAALILRNHRRGIKEQGIGFAQNGIRGTSQQHGWQGIYSVVDELHSSGPVTAFIKNRIRASNANPATIGKLAVRYGNADRSAASIYGFDQLGLRLGNAVRVAAQVEGIEGE